MKTLKNLAERQKVSKYYENDCLQNFIFLHISAVTAKYVKNSHIKARIYVIFLEIVLKQT